MKFHFVTKAFFNQLRFYYDLYDTDQMKILVLYNKITFSKSNYVNNLTSLVYIFYFTTWIPNSIEEEVYYHLSQC